MMGACSQNQKSDEACFDDFTRRASNARIPLDGSLELTHRCNLRCIHCYLGDQRQIRRHRRDELTTAEVKQLLDELAAAGTLNLTFTGGDPMVRKDFPELYEYAVRKGILVTVFCDGALINARIMTVFERFPPRKVEVSLYGACEPTYEHITRVKGSYQDCIQGIKALKAGGIRLTLKTVLMQDNHHELAQMRSLAEHYQVPFYFDTAIFACLPQAAAGSPDAPQGDIPVTMSNAGQAVTSYRLEPSLAARMHLSDSQRVTEMADLYLRTRDLPADNHLYKCAAAKSTFHIDPYGNLQACTISTNSRYNIREAGFMAGWTGPLAEIRNIKARPQSRCSNCDKQALCAGCPAFSFTEHNAGDIKSEYICQTTHLIFEGLESAIYLRLENSP